MRCIRIYEPAALTVGSCLTLNPENSAHLLKVLRLKKGALINVFDGMGHEVQAVLSCDHKTAVAAIEKDLDLTKESPLVIELGQVISKGERMEYVLQKAAELGAAMITPLFSSQCVIKIDKERLERKIISWQKVVNHSCEQCGRNVIPKVNPAMDLKDWISQEYQGISLVLDPQSTVRLKDLNPEGRYFRILTGPEGGLSDEESSCAKTQGFIGVTLGPRILRTETAPIAALAVLGSCFGDL